MCNDRTCNRPTTTRTEREVEYSVDMIETATAIAAPNEAITLKVKSFI